MINSVDVRYYNCRETGAEAFLIWGHVGGGIQCRAHSHTGSAQAWNKARLQFEDVPYKVLTDTPTVGAKTLVSCRNCCDLYVDHHEPGTDKCLFAPGFFDPIL
jgi:hypothetical protein